MNLGTDVFLEIEGTLHKEPVPVRETIEEIVVAINEGITILLLTNHSDAKLAVRTEHIHSLKEFEIIEDE